MSTPTSGQPPAPTPEEQQKAKERKDTRAGCGCMTALGVVFLIGVAYFAVKGNSDTSTTTTTTVATQAATSAAASAPPGPAVSQSAQHLADIDGDPRPAADYQTALDHLAVKCTQNEDKVAAIVNATLEDLTKNGVTDESEYSVIQHLDASIPAGSPRMDLIGVAAAYATLREG